MINNTYYFFWRFSKQRNYQPCSITYFNISNTTYINILIDKNKTSRKPLNSIQNVENDPIILKNILNNHLIQRTHNFSMIDNIIEYLFRYETPSPNIQYSLIEYCWLFASNVNVIQCHSCPVIYVIGMLYF